LGDVADGAGIEPVAKAAEVLRPFLKNPNEAPDVLSPDT
jgi:hypothetical protein